MSLRVSCPNCDAPVVFSASQAARRANVVCAECGTSTRPPRGRTTGGFGVVLVWLGTVIGIPACFLPCFSVGTASLGSKVGARVLTVELWQGVFILLSLVGALLTSFLMSRSDRPPHPGVVVVGMALGAIALTMGVLLLTTAYRAKTALASLGTSVYAGPEVGAYINVIAPAIIIAGSLIKARADGLM